jgi:hypothetical protein
MPLPAWRERQFGAKYANPAKEEAGLNVAAENQTAGFRRGGNVTSVLFSTIPIWPIRLGKPAVQLRIDLGDFVPVFLRRIQTDV